MPPRMCCCSDVCQSCDAITYLTIAGLSGPLCPTGACEAKNGTYVFRTVGTPVTTCAWTGSWAGNNCLVGFPPPATTYYVGYLSCGGAASWGIVFTNITGGIRVDVTIQIAYERNVSGTTYRASYIVRFRKEVTRCSEIAGDVPFLSLTFSTAVCPGSAGDSGDLCSLGTATVALG